MYFHGPYVSCPAPKGLQLKCFPFGGTGSHSKLRDGPAPALHDLASLLRNGALCGIAPYYQTASDACDYWHSMPLPRPLLGMWLWKQGKPAKAYFDRHFRSARLH